FEPGGAREGQSLAPYLTRLNEIRREHPALHRLRNLWFHQPDNDQIICYSKSEPRTAAGADDGDRDTVIVVVNLDPHHAQETTVRLDLPAFGLDWHERFRVRDELTGAEYSWGEHNYVR